MKKMNKKNEIGNRYGDFLIFAEYPDREPSNGCVKWVGECVECGARRVSNGNLLRTGHTVGVCRKCRAKAKRRKR